MKWPNDIYVHESGRDKKISGILSELKSDRIMVIGWGLNLLGPAPLPTATTLESAFNNTLWSLEKIETALKENFLDLLNRFFLKPSESLASTINEINNSAMKEFFNKSNLLHRGEAITAEKVLSDASLLIKFTSGESKKLYSGEIIFSQD